MKLYTDLEQSKKLSEILPIESADMFYRDNGKDVKLMWEHLSEIKVTSPCWSLTPLLNVIPQVELDSITQYDKKYWRCCAYFASDWHDTDWYENPIDACYEMVLKLHEQNKRT